MIRVSPTANASPGTGGTVTARAGQVAKLRNPGQVRITGIIGQDTPGVVDAQPARGKQRREPTAAQIVASPFGELEPV